jgi:hypothetical protein
MFDREFAASMLSLHAYAAPCKIRLIIPLNHVVLVITFVVWDYKILIFVVAKTYGSRTPITYLCPLT